MSKSDLYHNIVELKAKYPQVGVEKTELECLRKQEEEEEVEEGKESATFTVQSVQSW